MCSSGVHGLFSNVDRGYCRGGSGQKRGKGTEQQGLCCMKTTKMTKMAGVTWAKAWFTKSTALLLPRPSDTPLLTHPVLLQPKALKFVANPCPI